MRVSIIADDHLVIIDGKATKSHTPLPIDPDIHAVQYDTDKGWGEIEYRPIDPDGPEGPELPYKPANKKIVETEFAEHFATLVADVLKSVEVEAPAPAADIPNPSQSVPTESPVSYEVLDRLVHLESHLAGILPRILERIEALEMKFETLAQAAAEKLAQEGET